MFRFYDIRGVWGEEIDPERMTRLGTALSRLLDELAVGHDVRICSPLAAQHLMRGFGGEITYLGFTTTPMVYFYGWKASIEAVQVTASHNPPSYCGAKFVHSNGLDWSHGEIEELRKVYERTDAEPRPFRAVLEPDLLSGYFELYRGWEVPRVSLTFDPSNGAGYLFVPLLREKFDVHVVNGVPDGRFPNHPPDPTLPESQRDLFKYPTKWGALLDGDADRLVLRYEKRVLGSDEIVAFLAENGVVGRKVALEVMMPLKLERYLEDLGVKVVRTPTGRSLIKEMASRMGFDFFGEYSGHFGFREFNYIDDPLYTLFKVLETGGGTFETGYTPPHAEKFSLLMDKKTASRIVKELEPEEVRTLDGFDVRGKDVRVVLRQSRTEPKKWRVLVEGEDEERVKRTSALIRRVVEWNSPASS